jgi:Fe-S cluster biogenesis protein NfuA/nitrite reductase/ring-hydroxylating ferredoxin subunit
MADQSSAVQAVREFPARIDALLDDLHQAADPGVGQRADELVRCVVGLYGAGLERMVDILSSHPDSDRLARAMADDDVVSNLLLLHDLHPDPLTDRINAALDKVRPYLGSHAGGIDYLGVDDDGVAQLRFAGSCDGCPSSAVTVQLTIERALLEAAPELTAVHVEGMVEDKKPAPLLQIGRRPDSPAAERWYDITPAVAPGAASRVDVQGQPVLVCHLDDSYVAYRIPCPRCNNALSDGSLVDAELACHGCATRFDVRHAGIAMDGGVGLVPLPLLPEGAAWRIALAALPDLVAP